MATSRPSTWTEAQDAALVKLHAEGWTMSRVADELNKTKSAVQRRASSLGLRWDSREQMAIAVATHQERAAERREKADAMLQAARLQAAAYLVELAQGLHEDGAVFYRKGKGGEQVAVKRSPGDPIPVEHVESVVRMLDSMVMTDAKVETMRGDVKAALEKTESLLGSLASAVDGFRVDESVLDENREARPE